MYTACTRNRRNEISLICISPRMLCETTKQMNTLNHSKSSSSFRFGITTTNSLETSAATLLNPSTIKLSSNKFAISDQDISDQLEAHHIKKKSNYDSSNFNTNFQNVIDAKLRNMILLPFFSSRFVSRTTTQHRNITTGCRRTTENLLSNQ